MSGPQDSSNVSEGSLLAEDEHESFNTVHLYLSQRNHNEVRAIVIDSMGYDRQSHILQRISRMLGKRITYIVFRRTLANTFDQENEISGYTVHKFFMRKFGFDFDDVDLDDYKKDEFKILYNILRLVPQLQKTFEVLILDQYTIVSPWYVLWMYWIAKYHRVPIIFSGDKSMLGPMHPSRFRTENNYSIAKILAQPHCYKLQISDTEYRKKLVEFKQILDRTNSVVSLSNEFESKLRSLFAEKFSNEEDFQAIFISQNHSNLYQRAYRIGEYVKSRKDIKYYCIPYYARAGSTNLYDYTPISIKEVRVKNTKKEFLEFLLLIENFMYTYTPSYGVEKIVKFKDFDKANGIVIVEDVEYKMEYKLKRVELQFYHCVRKEYDWLQKINDNKPLYQFPLKLLCKTYHSIQGSIMPPFCNVELDLSESVTLNAIYTGLSSITTEEQLRFYGAKPTQGSLNIDIDQPGSSNLQHESNADQLIRFAIYLRNVPREDIEANRNSLENLKRHFEQWYNSNSDTEADL